MEAYKQPKQEPPKIRRYKTIYMRPGDAEAYEVLLAHGINVSDFLRHWVHAYSKELIKKDEAKQLQE